MTPQQIDAIKLALDFATMHHTDVGYAELRAKVRSAIKETLADYAMRETQRLGQEIEQEPVGAVYRCGNRSSISSFDGIRWTSLGLKLPDGALLYTSPPQRTWVGLTNKERAECWDTIPERAMKKVEAKLKEKNQ